MKTASTTLLAGLLFVAVTPAVRGDETRPLSFNFYLQQSWPQQTTTNRQIKEINQIFGTNFEDWDDVANLNIGAQLFWNFTPQWKLGLQVDYSRGSIEGREQVLTEAGPATLSFEQQYDIYADLYGAAQFFPWPELTKVRPFVYGGIGIAYESDTTTLKLRNEFIDSGLRVENSGWFPTYSAGLGIDVPFSPQSRWYAELGVAYVWARMENTVPAEGDLAPADKVTADTDLTGPNWWIGVGYAF